MMKLPKIDIFKTTAREKKTLKKKKHFDSKLMHQNEFLIPMLKEEIFNFRNFIIAHKNYRFF
jgi:cellulose synthase/poly-beta-1,6-N-acetylglucosamine synthase-like glycosyltransferase